MTVRLRPTTGSRRRSPADSEDRFQFWVTVAFIALIVVVVLVVLASIGIGYYNSHFKPIANVGSASITRDQWADRISLDSYRLKSLEGRTRTMLNSGEIDPVAGQAILSDISSKLTTKTLADQAANDLVNLTFKEQLAGSNGVAVTDADIEAQMVKDASTPEQRHVIAVVIAPTPALAGSDPTAKDRQNAYDQAQKAAAALQSGTPIDQVARQYSTDPSKAKGGDLGFMQSTDTTDTTWTNALFRLPLNGMTPVLKGADGTYRIGTVSEVKPGVVDPGFRQGAFQAVGEAPYRDQIRREAIAAKLSDKIVSDALSTQVDQIRMAEIQILIAGTDPATDVQIHASHILYSPKNDPQNAASIPPEDQSWTDARARADKAAGDLNAITDLTARAARFQEIAKSESDDKTSGAAGGELGTFTRDKMVAEFAAPLFDNAALKTGDIVGPVKSAFGWHVILFQARIPASNDRLNAAKAALAAPGADFAAVARQYSDGDEALQGGELGWRTASQLPPEVATKVLATDAGVTTDPIQINQGFFIEKIEEKAKRAPEGEQAVTLAATAFETWYADQKTKATQQKIIVTDSKVFTAS